MHKSRFIEPSQCDINNVYQRCLLSKGLKMNAEKWKVMVSSDASRVASCGAWPCGGCASRQLAKLYHMQKVGPYLHTV